MKLPATSKIVAALGGLVALALAVLPAANVVHWSTEQLTALGLAGTASVALVGAVIGHFRKGTAPEPVALGYSLTAALGAWFVVGNIFGWWSLDAASQTAILGAILVLFGGGTAAAARQTVTPVVPHVTARKNGPVDYGPQPDPSAQ